MAAVSGNRLTGEIGKALGARRRLVATQGGKGNRMASWQPLRLTLHPNSRCEAVERIEVGIGAPSTGHLSLRYLLTGDVSKIRWPVRKETVRADDLWKRTCFEAFVRDDDVETYTELNFSPSTEWAAYRFDHYRAGMRRFETTAPMITMLELNNCFELTATITRPAGPARFGFSAVIEEQNGAISYWALAHPPGKPDFHHADSFAFQLSTGDA